MKQLNWLMIFLFIGCSPKISRHFEQNRYIKNYNIHIVNDSLQMYIKSPADIVYTTDIKELKKIIRKGKLKLKDSVLIYGKTDDPPYEYYVTIAKENNRKYPVELFAYDTLINDKTIYFIGNPLSVNSKRTLEIDLTSIFNSLEIGEGYRKEISTVMDVVGKYQDSNQYFAALNEISAFPTYDKQEEWTKLQMQLTFSSFLGNNPLYEKYLNHLEYGFKPNDTISKIIKERSHIDSKAIEIIIDAAKDHRIVMVNENHFYPNHRVLVSDLLARLKNIGFNYLALEALDVKQDSLLNLKDSYPTLKTGFYTNEQNYSNLIRKAKMLGYTFVAYENVDENKEREIGQADNLYNKTFKTDPNSKVVVFAGIDHILEEPGKSEKKWMAAIFKEKYHIDPLTISQTHLNSYRKQTSMDYSIVDSKYFSNKRLRAVDFQILNNKINKLSDFGATFIYQNKEDTDVQISLFYGNEIENKYDYVKKVPYFSTIIEKGDEYNLPINKDEKVFLYTFDKNGKQMDKQVISPEDATSSDGHQVKR